jgi:concentrative nucleoside transporter, CNT family
MEQYNWVSFAGIFVLIGLAWLFSENKRNMNWRAVLWGTILQLVFAFFVFMVPAGANAFLFINDTVVKVLNAATAGTKFVFGGLALSPGEPGSMGFFLAFQTLPTIIFFSALMSILYYFRIMPLLVRGFAYVFTKLMRVSGAESLCTASNIFAGVESALTIRPHLPTMTRSELCVVLTAGMATVASNVLALYVFTLKAHFPTIAGHLISASILSAPAAILMAKIIVPETETPATLGQHIHPHYERESSVFEAIINGANAGVQLIVGIVALLLAVLGLVALVDLFTTYAGGHLNAAVGWQIDWSLKGLCGYIFYPLTVIIGVPLNDAWAIAKIIGERLIVTEVTSYQDLAVALQNNVIQNPRSTVIATYALCGFAHVASMAIFIGGISALAPGKTRVLAKLGFRALLAATLACLMTACMAGTFFNKGSILLGQ